MSVQVNEAYRQYTGPAWAREATTALLNAVDPRYLTRLSAVVLTNSDALTGTRKHGKTWSRARKGALNRCLGLYHAPTRTDGAWVEIFVDRVVSSAPIWVWRIPFLREVILSKTLYHELGHHIHQTQVPAYREREDVANQWSKRLARGMLRRRYPILMVVLQTLWWPWLILQRLRRRTGVMHRTSATMNRDDAT